MSNKCKKCGRGLKAKVAIAKGLGPSCAKGTPSEYTKTEMQSYNAEMKSIKESNTSPSIVNQATYIPVAKPTVSANDKSNIFNFKVAKDIDSVDLVNSTEKSRAALKDKLIASIPDKIRGDGKYALNRESKIKTIEFAFKRLERKLKAAGNIELLQKEALKESERLADKEENKKQSKLWVLTSNDLKGLSGKFYYWNNIDESCKEIETRSVRPNRSGKSLRYRDFAFDQERDNNSDWILDPKVKRDYKPGDYVQRQVMSQKSNKWNYTDTLRFVMITSPGNGRRGIFYALSKGERQAKAVDKIRDVIKSKLNKK